MTGRRVGVRLVAIAAVLLVASGSLGGVALAQQAPPVPASITLDRSTAHPGDDIIVQFHNWQSGYVTVSLCGNLALRGSTDCNIVGSEGVPLARFSPEPLTDFIVPVPPTACPCVVRAFNSTQTEIAYAPIVLVGIPSGPLVLPTDVSPLDAAVKVSRVHGGFGATLRSSMGGPTAYEVSVVLRNKSAETLSGVRPYGYAGRSKTDQSRILDFPVVGDLGPGQSWTHVIRVNTPAPHLGRFYWEVSVSGAGPPVHIETVSRDTPWLLVALVLLIVVDVLVMTIRWIRRRTRRPRPSSRDERLAESPAAVPLDMEPESSAAVSSL